MAHSTAFTFFLATALVVVMGAAGGGQQERLIDRRVDHVVIN